MPAERRPSFTGRGGAGNVKPALKDLTKSPRLQPVDLETPTIKSSTYTTGRGGTGNMAANDPKNPEVARAAQDVAAPVSGAGRQIPSTGGKVHVGRGGEGNVVKVPGAGAGGSATVPRGDDQKGVAEKGKQILGGLVDKAKP